MIEIGAGDIFPNCTVMAAKTQIRVQIEWCNFYEIQTFGLQYRNLDYYWLWNMVGTFQGDHSILNGPRPNAQSMYI